MMLDALGSPQGWKVSISWNDCISLFITDTCWPIGCLQVCILR
uniref:Uncharacterized protein n=1 Tax=Anguilla anguilla TaxID=7936 RepID=A0A0E9VY80_ANGAN